MATGEIVRPKSGILGERAATAHHTNVRDVATSVLTALASLRLTVVLFALSIVLVFFGTLAQKDSDVFQVLHSYFRVLVAHIELRTIERLVQIFNRNVQWNLRGTFPFPGGSMIGLALLVNLLAAHAVRFKIAARGQRLWIGLGLLAIGIAAVGTAIASGMNNTIESELSPTFCNFLWQAFRGLLVVVALVGANALRLVYGRIRPAEWCMFLAAEIVVAGLALLLLLRPGLRLDDSGLRLLWQFFKGAGAGLVLLAGGILVFRKRAGIVLIHGGVLLIMLGEVWTAFHAQESQVAIPEGGTTNYSETYREFELAVIDHSDAATDRVTVIPTSLLSDNVGQTRPIDDPNLPFAIEVSLWLPTAQLTTAREGLPNPATAGIGQQGVAVPAASTSENPALPAAYVDLIDKKAGKSLGTYLTAAQLPTNQAVEVDGKTYEITLRPKRFYWPFTLSLIDFRFDRYTGTNKPKNYSSLVELRDPGRQIDRDVKIWMNNPLRYAGYTAYQADFDHMTEKSTTLNVVANSTWMTPYVGCMVVAIGLVFHFGSMLYRFVRRQAEVADTMPELNRVRTLTPGKRGSRLVEQEIAEPAIGKWFPAFVVAFFAVYLVSKMPMPESQPNEMQIYEFAKLPVSYEGRIKPYDSLAINTLQFLSGRQELALIDTQGKVEEKKPAIRWLLDVISGREESDDYPIFRIENIDLIQTLGLEPRPGSWRYSWNEIMRKKALVDPPAASAGAAKAQPQAEAISELQRQTALAEAVKDEERSLFQNKVLQLATKKQTYDAIVYSFRSPPLSSDKDSFADSVAVTQRLIGMLTDAQAPCSVPPTQASTSWSTLLAAEFEGLQAAPRDGRSIRRRSLWATSSRHTLVATRRLSTSSSSSIAAFWPATTRRWRLTPGGSRLKA